MFGIFDSAVNSVCNSVSNTVDDFCHNPVGTALDIALQPVRDTVEVFAGLTEGELRTAAIARLGADIVGVWR